MYISSVISGEGVGGFEAKENSSKKAWATCNKFLLGGGSFKITLSKKILLNNYFSTLSSFNERLQI
jgi:hypothetical protein